MTETTTTVPAFKDLAIIAMDLETSGTEPGSLVFEVAAIGLTPDFSETLFEASWVVRHERDVLARAFADMDKVVWEMHRDNGLLDELLYGEERLPLGSGSLYSVQEQLRKLMDVYVPQKSLIRPERLWCLGGSGVGPFDYAFIKRDLPYVARCLHYRPLDVGQMRSWGQRFGFKPPAFNEAKTHRALDDVRLHVEESRWWMQWGRWIASLVDQFEPSETGLAKSLQVR